MTIEVKKISLLTIGSIFLIALGAWGMWVTTKLNSQQPVSPVVTAVSNPAPAQSNVTVTPVVPAPVAASAPAAPNYAVAKVTRVEAHYIYRSIPYRSCHYVYHTEYAPARSPTGLGAVIGGVAGGLGGNQIGEGRGNIAATIGGALIGAMVGNNVEERAEEPRPYTVYNTICRTHYYQHSVRSGYRVFYEYNGQTGNIIMSNPPSSGTIPLSLTPIGS